MAGWSLGLAIFGCSVVTWVLALAFAIQVLVESRRERLDHGRTLAIAALGLVAAWAVVGIVVLATGVLGSVQLPFDPAGDDGTSGHDGPTGRPTACADGRVGDC